jgi:hypothetical protein
MAVFTVTASDATALPRLVHTGETVVRTHLNTAMLPASFSASDIILIAKIPNKVLITDFYASGFVGGDGTVFHIGTAANENAVTSAMTFSATAELKRANSPNLPYKVSLSDDAQPQWTYLFAARASGTSTSTCSLQFVVKYAPYPGATGDV